MVEVKRNRGKRTGPTFTEATASSVGSRYLEVRDLSEIRRESTGKERFTESRRSPEIRENGGRRWTL
jgi:hypothetical protein